jgi:hypothetical protein
MNTIATAAKQYANRPQDERFPSLQAMIDHALHQKNHSAEKTYNLKDLEAVADAGEVKLASPKGTATFSHWSFGQASRMIGAPAGYLRSLPADIAASCLNYGLQSSPAGTAANLLIQAPNGNPEPMIRAATSESYGRVWDAELYSAIGRSIAQDQAWQLPPTWTGEPAGAYRGDRDSFLILCNGGSIVNDPSIRSSRNGEPDNGAMYRGLLVRNSEVGASSIVIETILYRYVCGNHMLWGAIVDKRFRRRHVGSTVARDTIKEINRIAMQWTHASAARDEAIIRNLIDHEIAHSEEAVIDELRAIGATAAQAKEAYTVTMQTESASPRSFWGLANGITRMSQEGGYQDERYALDRLAGLVLAKGAKQYA